MLVQSIGGLFIGFAFGVVVQHWVLAPYTSYANQKLFSAALREAIKDTDMQNILSMLAEGCLKPTHDKITTLQNHINSAVAELQSRQLFATNGIIGTYENRIQASGPIMKAIEIEMSSSPRKLSITGVSLQGFFVGYGDLHNKFEEMVKSRKNDPAEIRAVMLDLESNALRARAECEHNRNRKRNFNYTHCPTYTETSTAVDSATKLMDECHEILTVKVSEDFPLAFLVITSTQAFIEAYDYSSRGGGSLVFQVHANSPLYERYCSHFEFIWNRAHVLGEGKEGELLEAA